MLCLKTQIQTQKEPKLACQGKNTYIKNLGGCKNKLLDKIAI